MADHPTLAVDRHLPVHVLEYLQNLCQAVSHDGIDPQVVFGRQLDQAPETGRRVIALSKARPTGEREFGGSGAGGVLAAAVVDVVTADAEHVISETLARGRMPPPLHLQRCFGDRFPGRAEGQVSPNGHLVGVPNLFVRPQHFRSYPVAFIGAGRSHGVVELHGFFQGGYTLMV